MSESFDLTKVSGDQLIAFYGLNFAAAETDGSIDKDELTSIFETLELSTLNESQRERVRGFIIKPPEAGAMLDTIARGSEKFRYSVAVRIIEVLLADDVITPEEEKFLDEVCRRLIVTNEQQKAIIAFVQVSRRIAREGVDDNNAERALKGAASGLAAVGIPITAVYFSGSVVGLSAAGITSGLAAVGLGVGMVPGIGVAVLIGTAVYFGLRKALGDSRATKEKKLREEREQKAQRVIRNLQDTINGVLQSIAAMEEKAAESEANREMIRVLRARMNSLNRILEQKKANV
ncbi:TerB family tellurite resistance protein [bacterium]|nr:TerB family tellurite resistance protein [bacterium]